MEASAQPATSLERAWFLRTLLVLQKPRPVFAALRDDSEEAASARQEPALALVWLAGIAGVLSTPVAATLLDDPARDGIVVAMWAFLGGGLYGGIGFWLLGGLVYAGARALGGQGSYRRGRHVVAYASAPAALSLFVLWPIGIAAFGGDLFRSGGSDEGAAGDLFKGAAAAFGVWTLALLVIGVRSVHAWTWARSLATVALAVTPVVLVVLAHEFG